MAVYCIRMIGLLLIGISSACFGQSPLLLKNEAPELWTYIAENFTIEHHVNRPEVKEQIEWFTSHKKFVATVTDQAVPYMFYINQVAEKENMPGELVLLPIIESAFDPFAHSLVGAAGLWQFMPETASGVGIKQNWWFDGRRDIVTSTQAAMKYLEYLHKYFAGDWLLAIAAYNAGSGTVSRAIKANELAGLKTDFWSLKLPKETRIYVPRLLALSAIVAKPANYGILVPKVPANPYFAEVDVGFQIDLTQAAQLAEISLGEFYQLNAGYNHWTTDPDGPHKLLLPIQKLKNFEVNLQNKMGKHSNITRYVVQENETLAHISQKFKTVPQVIQKANQLDNNHIIPSQILLIPENTHFVSKETHYAKLQNRLKQFFHNTPKPLYYTVKAGDSLWKIAKQNKMNVSEIIALNSTTHDTQFTLHTGQKLLLKSPEQKKANPSGFANRLPYYVAKGDTLAMIARQNNISLQQLKQFNGLKSESIKPGQLLSIPANA